MVLDKENKLVEPLNFRRENQLHHEDCKRLSEKEFEIENLVKGVKMAVVENQSCSIQFIYERHRANAVRNGSTTVYPDFVRIKHRLRRKRNTNRTIVLANNLADVKVDNRFIADGYSLFLIYDKPGINRILVYCSFIGLIMLGKSLKWHADGTFQTKSKYFGQLYTI